MFALGGTDGKHLSQREHLDFIFLKECVLYHAHMQLILIEKLHFLSPFKVLLFLGFYCTNLVVGLFEGGIVLQWSKGLF